MTTYNVFSKATGDKAFSYSASAPVEWQGFEFALYDHLPEAEPSGPAALSTAKYAGRRQLTKLEFRSLLHTDEQENADEFEVMFESMEFPADVKKRIRTNLRKYTLATFINLDDSDTAMGLGLYVSLGILAPNRIDEVLNG